MIACSCRAIVCFLDVFPGISICKCTKFLFARKLMTALPQGKEMFIFTGTTKADHTNGHERVLLTVEPATCSIRCKATKTQRQNRGRKKEEGSEGDRRNMIQHSGRRQRRANAATRTIHLDGTGERQTAQRKNRTNGWDQQRPAKWPAMQCNAMQCNRNQNK